MVNDKSVSASLKNITIHPSDAFIYHIMAMRMYTLTRYLMSCAIYHAYPIINAVGLPWTMPQYGLQAFGDHCHTCDYKVEC